MRAGDFISATEEGAETEQIELVEARPKSCSPDLKALQDRLAITWIKRAPDAVAKLHTRGQRTARENLTDLCDAGSFLEYGQLVYAAQRSKIDKDSLMRISPADGIVAGFASINGDLFGDLRMNIPPVPPYSPTMPWSWPAPRAPMGIRKPTVYSTSPQNFHCPWCFLVAVVAGVPAMTMCWIPSVPHWI